MPFGSFSAIGWRSLRGRGASFPVPGTIYEPEGARPDYWRMARAPYMPRASARVDPGGFSYHLTPAGSMMETGAHASAAPVFPAAWATRNCSCRRCRPAPRLRRHAQLPAHPREGGRRRHRLPSLTKALVSGEAFPPSLRDWLAERGVQGYQCYATADVGPDRLRDQRARRHWSGRRRDPRDRAPGTGDPGARRRGRRGGDHRAEPDYPLVRFGTGDLRRAAGRLPHGRTNTRIKGLAGPRRPDRQGARHVRAPQPGGRVARRHPR